VKPLVMFSILMLTGSALTAQEFDTSSTFTLKGSVVTLFLDRPSYLIIESKDGTGKTVRWAIQGSPAGKLMQAGWTPQGTVSPGDQVSVVAYKTKTADVTSALPKPMSEETAKAVSEPARAGHLVRGTELTLPGGKKFAFGEKP
jgi:hypothetical protein